MKPYVMLYSETYRKSIHSLEHSIDTTVRTFTIESDDNDSINANYGTCAIYRTYSIYLIHS